MINNTKSTHLIIEVYGAKHLDDIKYIENVLKKCVSVANATLLNIKLHKFQPKGVSGVAILAESHISIHTWPEHEYAAIDIFMCGKTKPEKCVDVLNKAFECEKIEVNKLLRGKGNRWFSETLFKNQGLNVNYKSDSVIFESKTKYQNIVLFKNKIFGKMLMIDGAVQTTSKDEFIYHEMMAHVPIFSHGNVESVLIIGGGDCGIAKQVLKHKSIKNVTQVEIDPSMIDLAKKHFPEFAKSVFSDNRFISIIEDGMKYVSNTDQKFDVIIVDSTDPKGPGKKLFTKKFYQNCKKCLTRGGIIVTQNGVPILQSKQLSNTLSDLKSFFKDVSCYVISVPTYYGGHMTIGFASDNKQLRKISEKKLISLYKKSGNIETYYWTPKIHLSSFVLPKFIQNIVNGD